MNDNFASDLIEKFGADTLIDSLGLTARNLRHSRSTGQFAARWYRAIKELGDARDIEVPLCAFSFEKFQTDGGAAE